MANRIWDGILRIPDMGDEEVDRGDCRAGVVGGDIGTLGAPTVVAVVEDDATAEATSSVEIGGRAFCSFVSCATTGCSCMSVAA